MHEKRFNELRKSETMSITKDEADKGWHWCPEADYDLIGPGSNCFVNGKCEWCGFKANHK